MAPFHFLHVPMVWNRTDYKEIKPETKTPRNFLDHLSLLFDPLQIPDSQRLLTQIYFCKQNNGKHEIPVPSSRLYSKKISIVTIFSCFLFNCRTQNKGFRSFGSLGLFSFTVEKVIDGGIRGNQEGG